MGMKISAGGGKRHIGFQIISAFIARFELCISVSVAV